MEAGAILEAAPTPALAVKPTKPQLRQLLLKAGRQRNIDAWIDRLHTIFGSEQLRQPPPVEAAFGEQARALIMQLEAASRAVDHLAEATAEAFAKHPDAAILSSFPGVGTLTGARILAEIGDDHSRFADSRGLRAYAGSAPVTRASGKSLVVMQRKVKNQRLAAVGYIWAFAALTASPHARDSLRPPPRPRRRPRGRTAEPVQPLPQSAASLPHHRRNLPIRASFPSSAEPPRGLARPPRSIGPLRRYGHRVSDPVSTGGTMRLGAQCRPNYGTGSVRYAPPES